MAFSTLLRLKIILAISFIGLAVPMNLNAQALFYNSGQVFIDSAVIVHVNGTFLNEETPSPVQLNTILQNNGDITTANDVGPGNFVIRNNSIVGGDGNYFVEQNWNNNSPNFIPNTSNVILFGDQEQFIRGTEVTTFSVLELRGNGLTISDKIKRMEVDVRIKDSLYLNNREMATDYYTLFIQNPDPGALTSSLVLEDEGFVSSLEDPILGDGLISRRTSNSSEAYIFPVGSSISPPSGKNFVYRPVYLTPSSAAVNIFTVRFNYNDPTLDGFDVSLYDSTICTVNDLYYHYINHPLGFDSAQTSIIYDPIEDGIYDRIAKWDFVQGQGKLWENIQKSRLSSFNPNYNAVTINNNRIYSRDTIPFALVDLFPVKPSISGPTQVCSGSTNRLFTAKSNTNFYEWQIPAGISIESGANNDSIRLAFDSTGGVIRAVASSATGQCKEVSDSLFVTLNPSPIAGFTSDTNNVFTKFDIEFIDTSFGNPVDWLWYFGDGDSSLSPVPEHSYDEIGQYRVTLIIRDSKGCRDSTSSIYFIIEGIQIPNVFTPNGDGVNDVFRIANSGLATYHIKIFNRWGSLVFETTAPEILWDGRNPEGSEVSAGTYYYVLTANSDQVNYDKNGYITVLK